MAVRFVGINVIGHHHCLRNVGRYQRGNKKQ
jgi:hypothetical protein